MVSERHLGAVLTLDEASHLVELQEGPEFSVLGKVTYLEQFPMVDHPYLPSGV